MLIVPDPFHAKTCLSIALEKFLRDPLPKYDSLFFCIASPKNEKSICFSSGLIVNDSDVPVNFLRLPLPISAAPIPMTEVPCSGRIPLP